ncbi:probable ubiquitin carboxyl-terminal hydrolase 8 isoform X2 [Mizuhopecten yessoensis]|uniref:probable ubiquitin carboxyl-terminal hydrolase 8 isoform X2 n=1 Tax=Mizuhopecten yessoensis TaxID=6573 RepID=UPI000B457ED0|nr:probable ubiquitin carboxyl-terminal hydrolase 8 isoform X2 [Mizuhopecten yessoensis]
MVDRGPPDMTLLKFIPKGLPNRNSTSCYITSLIQVLAQTPGLMECLLSYKQKSCIAETLINLFCVVNDVQDPHENVADVLCSLLRDIQNKMAARDDSYSEGIQNDSHCLLLCLLNALDDEERDGLYIFDGQMRNSFTYSNCSHVEESALEPFKSLPMSVNNKLSTVEDSIMHMISVDTFYDSDIPCRKCIKEGRHSQDTVTEKRLIIVVAPEILVLQLSRFHQVWASGDKLCTKMEKYDGHVQYSSTLSLPVIQKDEDDHTGCAVTYELYGVICHEGTMENGHYWCYVKQNGWDKAHPYLWHLCSDSYVRRLEINEEWPDSPYAYLLFYKQCMKEKG